MNKAGSAFRTDIQGIRAVAIVLVVISHAKLGFFSGGFVGVDVFFVLSGFLITGMLFREFSTFNKVNYIDFLARRLTRLLPVLLVMICIVLLAASVTLSGFEIIGQAGSAIYASSWTSNLFFAFTKFDYFSELQINDLFLHTWSLGLEEQFYLFWPFLLIVILYFKSKVSSRHASKVIVISFLIVFVVSFNLSLYWLREDPVLAYYLMPSRIWQFALGGAVVLWFDRKNTGVEGLGAGKLAINHNLLGITGFILVLFSAVIINPKSSYPGYLALLPSLGASFLIMACGDGFVGKLLSSKVFVWLGDRSYSLYIWHWPILMLGFSIGMEGLMVETLGLLMLSLLMAMLSYRFVELPFWKGRFKSSSSSKAIVYSVALMAIVMLSATNYLSSIKNGDEGLKLANAAKSDVPAIYFQKCDTWYHSTELTPCVVGSSAAAKTVVLIGDSIVGQWFSMVPAIFKGPSWRVIVLTKSSCPMVDEDYFYERIGKVNEVCKQWRRKAVDYVQSLKPEVVIIGNAGSYGYSDKQWVEGSRRVLGALSSASRGVVVIPTTPTLPFDGPGCLSREYSKKWWQDVGSNDGCIAKGRIELVSPIIELMRKSTEMLDNVMFMDLNDLVCPGDICRAVNEEGLVVFRDNQHLTDSFVRAQVLVIADRLKKLGL